MKSFVTRSVELKRVALLIALALSGCSTFKPPQISYDDDVPPSPELPAPTDDHARPLHVPPPWTPARGGKKGEAEAKDPTGRVETANDVARVQPRRSGYFNAVQIFPIAPARSIKSMPRQGRLPILHSSPVNS